MFQCDSACFGLHYIPHYWTQLMKTFSSKRRALGIVVFTYLDNIIILGPLRPYLLRLRPLVLRDSEASGVTINSPKSVVEPSQVVDALGFVVDFTEGELLVRACKRKGFRKEAGKVFQSPVMTPCKMAAILGRLRSLLPAMPALRAFTDMLVQFVRKVNNVGWDTRCVVPIQLKDQVRAITGLLHSSPGRRFVTSNQQPKRHLAPDATLFAWGGLNVQDPAKWCTIFGASEGTSATRN